MSIVSRITALFASLILSSFVVAAEPEVKADTYSVDTDWSSQQFQTLAQMDDEGMEGEGEGEGDDEEDLPIEE